MIGKGVEIDSIKVNLRIPRNVKSPLTIPLPRTLLPPSGYSPTTQTHILRRKPRSYNLSKYHQATETSDPHLRPTSCVENHDPIISHNTIEPLKMARMSLTSPIVQADDTKLQSCADFRRRWTPTEFCKLSKSERTTILQKVLVSYDSIVIVQVDGGYNFATEYTQIHEAMPLLYDFNTNKQIAREACEVFYQVGRVRSSVSSDETLTSCFAEQHIHSSLSLASPHACRSDRYMDHA